MKKILVLGVLFFSSSLFSMELDIIRQKAATVKNISKKMHVDSKSVFVPNRLGEVKLFHSDKGFCVYKDDTKYPVQKYHTDKMVRDLTKEQLQAFLAVGYVCLNQMDNGEYSLKANGRINGGGPLLGAAMYWVTKSLCYGTAAVAVGTVAVTTGGVVVVAGTQTAAAAGALAIGGSLAAPAAIATTAGVITATGGTAAVVVGTGVAAVGVGAATATAAGVTVAGVSVGTAATLTTAAGVTAAASSGAAASIGTGAAIVLGIETLSTAVGTFFGMLPTP